MKNSLNQALTKENSTTGLISKSTLRGDLGGLIFIILFILSGINLQAQNPPSTAQWSNISAKLGSVSATSNLADVHFIYANEGLISSGNMSEVYVTTDGGNSFNTRTVPNNDFLNSIWMFSATEFYGGSQLGRIYRSTNGGANWTSLGATGTQMRSIAFPPSSNTGFSCGDYGKSYQISSTGITILRIRLNCCGE